VFLLASSVLGVCVCVCVRVRVRARARGRARGPRFVYNSCVS
jgi:hypothetical protein